MNSKKKITATNALSRVNQKRATVAALRKVAKARKLSYATPLA